MGVYTGTLPGAFGVEPHRASEVEELRLALDALTSVWTTWTPTLTNLTQGSGTVTARYRRLGKTVDYIFQFVYGSGSAVGSSPAFTLPVAPTAPWNVTFLTIGWASLIDSGTTQAYGVARFNSGSTCDIVSQLASGTFVAPNPISSTSPWTWATDDSITVVGTYEVA